MSRLLDTLRSGHVVLMDGAMGTELQRAGKPDNEPCEAWNLKHPDQVLAIHQAYVNAGADCILTNTFQANPTALLKHDLHEEWKEIYTAAYRIACDAAGPDRCVLIGLGPGLPHAEPGDYSDRYREFIWSLQPDGVVLETQSHLADLAFIETSIRLVDETPSLPLLVSFTYRREPNGEVTTGPERRPAHPPEYFAEHARRLGADAIGVNCGRDIGMNEIVAIVRGYRQATHLPIFARPNAGTPNHVDGRWLYPRTPAMVAERLPELLEAGVSMIGGCCGTTPEHIAAFRPIVDAWNARNPGEKQP